jgi:hypothetical protein
MGEFKVLPTDPRFLELFDEQKVYIYEAVSSLPDIKLLKTVQGLMNEKEKIKKRDYKDFISSPALNFMVKTLRRQGSSEAVINAELKRQSEFKKKFDLEEVDSKIAALLGKTTQVDARQKLNERRENILKQHRRKK